MDPAANELTSELIGWEGGALSGLSMPSRSKLGCCCTGGGGAGAGAGAGGGPGGSAAGALRPSRTGAEAATPGSETSKVG